MAEEGSSEEYMEIVSNAEFLDGSVIFHLVRDSVGFVLYMHQQIPSVLQDMTLEFDTLCTEFKELELDLTQSEVKKVSVRRKHISRMREIKREIKRVEKLMNTVSSLQTALQLMVREIPNVQKVMLVLGGSPIRPRYVYELFFSHGEVVSSGSGDFSKSKAAEMLSRKAIRALISKDAGSSSYPGPTKLFLLVKAPSSFNLPQHFLPKRDFRYSKKIVPFRLRFKCRTRVGEMDSLHHASQTRNSTCLKDAISNDFIWFQCRHVIKGLALEGREEE
ncbi:uncharacterized protein LOC110814747 [Carica papaya]|uniref:uncharacterized protein LOC110814747 n=1 Tax=Carica papaya TaxID=3649 RepID=UPI000B8C87CF|nr:uncharacterized protein LOC110814747 [Carica papaya]